jgi:hypothetical protein
MADRDADEISTLLQPERYIALEEALKTDAIDVFKTFFETEDTPLNPDDFLFQIPLLFIAAGCRKGDTHYSKSCVEYLVEKGAFIDRHSIGTKAEKYSSAYQFWYDYNDGQLEEIHVYTTVLMNLVLEGNIEACNFFYQHGAHLDLETLDDWQVPIEGETVLQLAERKLTELDSSIIFGVEDNIWLEGGPEHLTKERIKVARGLKWLRYITVDENIPRHVAFWQNRARLRQVLRGAPGIGRLEANYMMSFLPKPAKFQKPSNINLRKINTSLFEGGRATRKRRQQRKQRKTRSK